MYQDNMSTIRLIGHKGNTGRMKHIALRIDFVREQVRLGTIRIEHLHTTKMTADTLTKNTKNTNSNSSYARYY